MSMDKVPPTDWQKKADYTDKSQHREWIQSGGTSTNNFDLSDGKHTMYAAVGMDGSLGLGEWSGVADIGGVTRPIERVDFNTLARFEFTVRGGKVIDSTKTTAAPKGPATTTRSGGESSTTTQTTTTQKANNMLDGAKKWIESHNRDLKVATIIGVTAAGITGVVAWAATRKKRRM